MATPTFFDFASPGYCTHATTAEPNTVEPPNKGRVGALIDVHYLEVAFIGEFYLRITMYCYTLGHSKQNIIHCHSDWLIIL